MSDFIGVHVPIAKKIDDLIYTMVFEIAQNQKTSIFENEAFEDLIVPMRLVAGDFIGFHSDSDDNPFNRLEKTVALYNHEFNRSATNGEFEEKPVELYFVNKYIRNQQYGGREEGGWWYDTGEFVECLGVRDSFDDAKEIALLHKAQVDDENMGMPPLHSVACRGISDIIIEPHYGHDFPLRQPIYE